MTAVPGPIGQLATTEDAGRACPYCRFAIKPGAELLRCGACGAAHHAECWGDNRGCAIMACVAGPGATHATDTTLVPPPQPNAPLAPAASGSFAATPPPAPLGGRTRPSRGVGAIAAILVLALAVGAGAVAYIVSRAPRPATASTQPPVIDETSSTANGDDGGLLDPITDGSSDDSSSSDYGTSSGDDTTGTDDVSDVDAGADSSTSTGRLPDATRSEMRVEIHDMLREWHQAIVDGDYGTAWDMLTARKRRQKRREDGYDKWTKSQSSLAGYIDPQALRVSIVSTDQDTGVATVRVSGMGWSKPGAPCNDYSGITWVRYEDGAWHYDPGYSTTAERRAEWEPRSTELMGIQCS